MWERRVEKLPLVDEEGRIRGLVTMRDLHLFKRKPYSVKDERGRLRVGAAIGAAGDYLERAAALAEAEVDVVLMDVAHAHAEILGRAVPAFRKRFPGIPLVVGNVATGDGARFLADLGAAAIKVGVGPGRGCRTRLETGAGVPQLQAIREAWLATEGKVPIIADGGIRNDKDVFLALACGASTVMLGSLLSGTDESPGIVVDDPATRQKMKLYRGMTSPEAVVDGSTDARRRRRPRHARRGAVGPRPLRRERRRRPLADRRPPPLGRQLRGRDDPRGGAPEDRRGPGALPRPALGRGADGVVRPLRRRQARRSRAGGSPGGSDARSRRKARKSAKKRRRSSHRHREPPAARSPEGGVRLARLLRRLAARPRAERGAREARTGRRRRQDVARPSTGSTARRWPARRASRLLDLLAALSHQTSFAVGCYCADEALCHRSVLRELLAERGADVE